MRNATICFLVRRRIWCSQKSFNWAKRLPVISSLLFKEIQVLNTWQLFVGQDYTWVRSYAQSIKDWNGAESGLRTWITIEIWKEWEQWRVYMVLVEMNIVASMCCCAWIIFHLYIEKVEMLWRSEWIFIARNRFRNGIVYTNRLDWKLCGDPCLVFHIYAGAKL